MKADAPRRKVFNDAVDLITGGEPAAEGGSIITMLPIDEIKPFRNHPFKLYEGERLNDMVESIKEHGILNPVIVRKYNGIYEMLSGHNRQNAGKIAGLKEIPAIVKEKLSDDEAYVYLIETNLMQRSFTDLSITEKAAVLAERYDKVFYQRKRDEIIAEIKALEDPSGGKYEKGGQVEHHSKNRDLIGDEYGLSGSSVARLIRINSLIPEFKEQVDRKELSMSAAVDLSFLPEIGQKTALNASQKAGKPISMAAASKIRAGEMTEKAIFEAIAGVQPKPDPFGIAEEEKPVYKPIKLSAGIREKYFADTPSKEVEGIIDKALAAWFKKRGKS